MENMKIPGPEEKMEPDPDGVTQQVAVIMTGKVYRDAGLKHSKHPKVEGLLYDKLCQIGKHRLRDDVRKMALNIATSVRDKEFVPTVAWLDNFMRRFCLSKKKMGFHSAAMLKVKANQSKPDQTAASPDKGLSQEEVFSALGFSTVNLEPGMENGSSTGEATNGKGGEENGVSGVNNDVDPLSLSDDDCSAQKEGDSNGAEKEGDSNGAEKEGDSNGAEKEDDGNGKIGNDVMEVDSLQEKDKEDNDIEITEIKDKTASLDAKTENKDEITKDKEDGSEMNTTKGPDDDADVVEVDEGSGSSNDEDDDEEDTSNSSEDSENDDSGSNGSGSDDDDGDKKKKPNLTEAEENERKKSKQEEDEEIIEYSKEELKYYRKNIETLQKRLSASVVRCSSCFEQVNHQLRGLVHTHPVLGIFICKRCRKYYGKGKFCKDEDGYDEYCRLCAEGGDLLCCEQEGCFNGFCKRCIKRVMGRTELRNAENAKNWACYICDRTPMMELRAMHRAILNNLKAEEEHNTNLSRKELREREIKSKFALLKRNRLEKASKSTPVKSAKTAKKKLAAKREPWLKDIIGNFTEMLKECLHNVEKIDVVWGTKYEYSKEGTIKTGKRIHKQLYALRNNFQLMENNITVELDKMTTEGEKENAKDSEEKKKKVDKAKKDDVNNDASDHEEDNEEDEEKDDDTVKKPKKSDEKDDEKDEERDENKDGDGDEKKDRERDGENDADDSIRKTRGKTRKSKRENDACSDKNNDKKEEEKKGDILEEDDGPKAKRRGRSKKSDAENSISDDKKGSEKNDTTQKITESRSKSSVVDDNELQADEDKTEKGSKNGEDNDAESDDEVPGNEDALMEVNDSQDSSNSPCPSPGNTQGASDSDARTSKAGNDGVDDDEDESPKRRGVRKSARKSTSKEVEDEIEISKKKGNKKCKTDKDKKKADDADNEKEEEASNSISEDDKRIRKSGRRTGAKGKDDEKEEEETNSISEEEKKIRKSGRRTGAKDKDDKEKEEEETNSISEEVKIRKSGRRTGTTDKEDDEKEVEETNSISEDDKKVRKSGRRTGATGKDDDEKEEEETNSISEDDKKVRKSGRRTGATDKDDDNEKEETNSISEDDKQVRKSGRRTGATDKDDNENTKKTESKLKKTAKGKESKSDKEVDDEEDKEDGSGEEENKQKQQKVSLSRRRSRRSQVNEEDDESKETEERDDKVKKIKEEEGGDKLRKIKEESDDKGKIKKENIKKEGKECSQEKDKIIKNEKIKDDDESKGIKIKKEKNDDESKQEKEKKKSKKKNDDEDDEDEKSEKETHLKNKEKDKKRKRGDESEAGEKKPARKRGKRKSTEDDDSDDSLLGIGSPITGEDDDTSEENTDKEMERRRRDHAVKTKKDKMEMKIQNDSEDEDEDGGKESGSRKKPSPKKKGKKESKIDKKNKEALSSLLASDSDEEEKEKDQSKSKKNKTAKDSDDKNTVVSETSETENSDEDNKKKKKNRKHSKPTNDNEKAKDALLESESDDYLEDKPKPKCKKKNYKEPRVSVSGESRKQKLIRLERKKLSEEKREDLKKEQLENKAVVSIEKMSSTVLEALSEDEFIDITQHQELDYDPPTEQDQAIYDGDAEEDESDQEFSKLMKFNVNKKFCKPGPKSKKKFQTPDTDDEEVGVNEDENKSSTEEEGGKKVVSQKKKKEGLLDISIDNEDPDDPDEEEEDDTHNKKKKKEGGINLNEKLKKNLLLSTDDEEEEEEEEEGDKNNPEEEEKERKKHELRKKKKKEKDEEETENKNENEGESDEESAPRVAKQGYVKLNITSDEDEDFNDSKDEDSDYNDESDFEESPRKRRTFQISSSDSDSDGGKKKKKRKKAESSDYNTEDEEEEQPKNKRKRIKKVSSSSEGDDEDDEEGDGDGDKEKDESPSKHKKIRRVIRDEDLMETTKNATQEEDERRKRIAERQKHFNQLFEIDVEEDQKDLGKLVLDFDPDSKKELVCVNEKLVKFLKPHQFKGIKFMWDSTIESVDMLREKKPGSGCILAHCMGLGKTLQVITYIHTLLTNKKCCRHIQRVMVCCPVNTVYNWVAEFNQWLKGKMLPFDVSELVSAKDLWGRAYRLDDWYREGGVCIMGYDMYRNLSNPKGKRFKGKMKEIFLKSLVDPGPDIIICDEGHILKNEKTALSLAINKIKTLRRIVLTGTPLQNNLKEYHCMIQFVKPNLLGTKKEFMNRFVNPIEQGQCAEAQPRDVRRMKRRAHILHNMLEGCVQRFDYSVLKPFLPPKFEYVISIQLSEVQVKLYQYYLDNLAQGGPKRGGSGLFVDYGQLSRIWTHPKVLELAVNRALLRDDDEEEMDDFICDDTTEESSSDDERAKKKKKKTVVKEKGKKDEDSEEIIEEEEVDKEEAGPPGPIPGMTASGKVRVDWWKKVLADIVGDNFEEEDYFDKLDHSGKLLLLLEILRESCSIGDKVLLFSQSLLALDMIEDFLYLIDAGELELPETDESLPMPFKKWKKERDYVRLDGSTNVDLRKQMCKAFNNTTNERLRLFLISTRAGGLGINLVAANRVIIFDSSWNPSHDSQSIFRVYRFGQKKPCYVYRFVAQGTMEEKIYSRQVTKMSTALRVVDEHQIKRYFKMEDLAQLYEFTPANTEERETPAVPEDRLLAELLKRHKTWIVNYHEHDSLLENQTGEELSEEERKAAWEDYENEKKGFFVQNQRNNVMSVVGNMQMQTQAGMPSLSLASFSFEGVVNTIKAQNPTLSQNDLCESVVLATKQIQRIHLNHYQRVQGMVYNLKNPMIAPEQRKLLPFGNHPEMLPMLEQQLRLLEDNIQRENQVINHMTSITPQRKDAYASMQMSAGLVRGQPPTSDTSAASANFVGRSMVGPSATTSAPTTSGSLQKKDSDKKKDGSSDVIMLD